MVKDPVCGMDVEEKKAEQKKLVVTKNGGKHYFCSVGCKEKFENKVPWHRGEKFGKLFPYFLGVVLVAGTVLSIMFNFMVLYMGIFFIIFALFKMPDWKGFVTAFREYDLLAKRFKFYGWIYPLIELALGALFLINYFGSGSFLIGVAWFTLIIMGLGAIGVSLKLLKKEKFQCACLGTWINVPLTKVTLLEDLLMVGMSLIIIIS
jgi:YHS domain-containing protein